MNSKDKQRLLRIQKIITAVPFSASGTATSTGYGAIMYEEDMRALRPYLVKVFEGMALENIPEFEMGTDYYNPDETLLLIENWIVKRNQEGWENASRYSIEIFVKEARKNENKTNNYY